ncbi:MAG: substrate-binding domain-containing protein [Desulfobulbaceae bacterium]|nr:substrate-binding domain-containing protein [Desulfobulbaceae bacterium]
MNEAAFPTIPTDRVEDLHNLEIADSADLILFMAGNQFMVMDEIVSAFQKKHPEITRIFYETLPPGLELRQILAGGAYFRDRLISVHPDIYASVNERAMKVLMDNDHIEPGDYRIYLHNRLTMMVPEGNPAGIKSVSDLAGDEVRISQPDPNNEDIAFHIMDMYKQAGGSRLVDRIMHEKRAEGTTIPTIVHHRETPLRIRKRTVDVGPVWETEAVYAAKSGLPMDKVDPGEALNQRDRINYYICKLKRAQHPENAMKFLEFIQSPSAREIYQVHGFIPA